MTWMDKTALEMAAALQSGEVTSVELVEESLERIAQLNPTVNAFVKVDREGALRTAEEVDAIRSEGGDLHPLAGVPVAVKDNIVTRGLETTCASKILEGWIPPYDATVVAKLKDAKLPIVGKTNLDEFAMGSTTETSIHGPTRNPIDPQRTPGGSSGGSAAAVAAYMVPFALGTDTGGSIRQPAAFTGIVGVKPTYGAVSRYGAVALASSLDQVGPLARNVADAAALQEIIGGHDPFDSTSLPGSSEQILAGATNPGNVLDGLKVGVVEQTRGEGYAPGVLTAFEKTIGALEAAGAQVTDVSLPSFEGALGAYYVIMPAEAYSNLGRFDGVEYGQRFYPDGIENPTAWQMSAATRGKGFGTEVKRRIILGAHVLSAENFKTGFEAAEKVRTQTVHETAEAFEDVDVLLTPTTPTVAFALGAELDPIEMYQNDVATVPANLIGAAAIALPNGNDEDGMPVSAQIMVPAGSDALLYQVAAAVEQALSGNVNPTPFEPIEAKGGEAAK